MGGLLELSLTVNSRVEDCSLGPEKVSGLTEISRREEMSCTGNNIAVINDELSVYKVSAFKTGLDYIQSDPVNAHSARMSE